ncbi:hypothetical protein BV20DRAFT_979848 [Pilatotrama ljubarskyi]|nr:hypothetical protein BV20DRAFT_979848 [Pilatotrama ljubarskyi]
MNFSPADLHSYWDISAQQPDSFSALPDDDFLAFLQKQFPSAVGNNPPLSFDNPDGVDPQSISSFPPLNNSPPSSDSSPSPPSTHHESSLSRRQSGAFNDSPSSTSADQQKGQQQSQQEDGTLKRKAANESEDEPQHKSQHTASSSATTTKKGGSTSSRRKSGTPQDESRLLKRKEQNRAAQRAFRERKERHVKDLEDKVAALEAKNQMTEQENENLRDLLQRLQNENMMLKQAAFTFTAPHGNVGNAANAGQSSVNNHMQFNFSSPGAGPSKSPVQSQPPQPQQQFDLNFNSLIPFDPNMLNPAEDFPGDMDMNVDSAFPYNNGSYKTIASNPLFTSFAEPTPGDSPPLLVNGGHQFTPGSFDSFTEHWTPPESQDALEQLFGANFLSPNANSVTDFQALLASSPSSISPVSHASMRTPSLSSSSSSPDHATGASSPQTANGSPSLHHMGECPKTKAELSKVISESGQSSFVQSPPPIAKNSPSSGIGTEKGSPSANGNTNTNGGPACDMSIAPMLKKAVDDNGTGPIVMCKGSSFPRTEKSDKNVEVLTAWRSITSNPQFKDVDINELCSEFTSKARCDGTKVVLEPEGVHHIIETLAAKQAQAQQAHK